jgi:hypothetical protein
MSKYKTTLTTISLSLEDLKKDLMAEGDIFISNLEAFILKQQRGGMSDELIVQSLLDDFMNDGPVFGNLKNIISDNIGGFTNNLVDAEKNMVISDELAMAGIEDPNMMWVAMLMNTCSECLELHGQVKTQNEWEAEGLPSVRPTPCTFRGYCHCILTPVDLMTSDDLASVKDPIHLAKENIAAYTEMRKKDGVSLSQGYKDMLLGQANNPESVVVK